MPISTESLRGCVMRQLFRGRRHLIFVEFPGGSSSRTVCEVARDGDGYKPVGLRMQWQENGQTPDEAINIAAHYLAETKL